MKSLRFSWDPQKANSNAHKHGVTFEEAKTIFYDDSAVEFYDDENSDWEDRFLLTRREFEASLTVGLPLLPRK